MRLQGANTSNDGESITRQLAVWLVPYLAAWAICAWMIWGWPAADLRSDGGSHFLVRVAGLLLVFKWQPALAMLPIVWRSKLGHAVIGLGIIATIATDAFLLILALSQLWSREFVVLAVALLLKIAFDLWVLGRVSARREVVAANGAEQPAAST